MGNAIFCAPSMIAGGATRVLLTNGRSEIYVGKVKAADIMMENPGHFLCDSTTLQIGRRIQALAADEDLKRRRFYFLLPMELLYSVLTSEEMSSLTAKASKAQSRHGSNFQSFGKIFPLCISEFWGFPAENKKEESGENDEDEDVERVFELRSYSWKPALDTIVES